MRLLPPSSVTRSVRSSSASKPWRLPLVWRMLTGTRPTGINTGQPTTHHSCCRCVSVCGGRTDYPGWFLCVLSCTPLCVCVCSDTTTDVQAGPRHLHTHLPPLPHLPRHPAMPVCAPPPKHTHHTHNRHTSRTRFSTRDSCCLCPTQQKTSTRLFVRLHPPSTPLCTGIQAGPSVHRAPRGHLP